MANGVGQPRILYTAKDAAALQDAMLEVARERLPAWTDQSPNDLGRLLVELMAFMGDTLSYYQDRIANESFLETAAEPRSVVRLLRLIGYELRAPRPATAALTLGFKSDGGGVITIPSNTHFKSTTKVSGTTIGFEYVGPPLSFDLTKLSLGPISGQLYRVFEPLPVEQVDADVAAEKLGSSDGTGGQRFALARPSLITGSLVVSVDAGTGLKAWAQQDTLLNSRPDDEHYIVQRDEADIAWVVFGDNKYGKIPPRGTNNIVADYRVGGGAKGNVAAATITKAVEAIDPQFKKVSNKDAATGGADRETLTDAVLRAPRQFRSMDRAVTAGDYESHALQFGVGKARARAVSWNNVELFVAPVGGGHPTDTLKQDLRRYFETKRMVTSIVDIRDPVYVAVYLDGVLEVQPYYFADQVRQRAENAIQALLAFDRVSFEDTLYLSEIYQAVVEVEGVKSVTVKNFSTSPTLPWSLPSDGQMLFTWEQIPKAGYEQGMQFTVLGGRSAAA